nr:putative ribonuclease H-like domain-containing protein [Tanacetum cinerariifolium]
ERGRIEAIRLFLAYALFMGFMVYQMDVKSTFPYERIEEEVYVCQHPRFEDIDHPDKVYKVVKALYVNNVRLSDDFFGADNDMRSLDEVELDISNISTTYPVSTTPNTRINKDHSLDNVIDGRKSAFLYGRIKEEVYVCQPPGFEDPDYLDKVYKVEKAIYDLHQAPRAWYETLAKYLLDNGFCRGKIDQPCSSRDKRGYSACTSVC